VAVELATGYVSLVPSAKGFVAKAKDEIGGGLGGVGKDTGEEVGSKFSTGFGSKLQGIGKVLGGALVAGGVTTLVSGAVGAASDLNESQSKVGVVFGDSAQAIEDWAKTAATSMGQSRQQALEAAGTFGNLFTALNIGQGPAADMSKSLVGLAGDLASFNNVDPQEALDALRAGLTGETEPLKRFGVNMNEATLQAKAMELGLSDGKKPLDANAKAQAAYALILEQTTTAQGDFARTSDGLANKQRIMAAQIDDAKAKIGQALLPVMTKLADVVATKLVPAFTSFTEWLGKHKTIAVALGVVVGGVLVAAFISWAVAAATAAAATIAAAAPVLLVVAGIGALVAAVILIVKHFDIFKAAAGAVFGFVKDVAKDALDWLKANWPLLLAILTGPIGVAVLLIVKNWDAIKDAATGAARGVGDRIRDIVGFFTGLASSIGGAVAGAVTWLVQTGIDIVQGLWNGIQSLWGTVTSFFTGLAGDVLGWIGDAASWLFDKGVDIITGLIDGYLSIIGTVTSFFTGLAGDVLGWIGDAASWLVDKGKDIIGGALVGLGQKELELASYIGGIAGKVLGWIGDAAKWLYDKGKDIFVGLSRGLYDKEVDIVRFFTDLPGNIVSWVGNLGRILFDAGKAVITGLWDGISSMFGWLGDKLGGIGGFIADHKGPPAKDAKILFGAGQLIMQGLQAGIESQTGALRAQLAGVTDMVSGAGGTVGVNGVATVAPVRAVAASLPVDATGAAGAAQVINVNLSGSNVWGDAKSAARQLNEELRKLQRSVG
jgi:hypothetical protein